MSVTNRGTIRNVNDFYPTSLYTINSLNELIKSLNGGVVDSKFPINWIHYRNSILLTQMGDLKQLNTKIYKIIDL